MNLFYMFKKLNRDVEDRGAKLNFQKWQLQCLKNVLDKIQKQIRYYRRKDIEHGDIAIVVIQNETNTERKIRVSVSCGTTSSSQIYNLKGGGDKKILEEIVAKICPNLMKTINLQIEEVQ